MTPRKTRDVLLITAIAGTAVVTAATCTGCIVRATRTLQHRLEGVRKRLTAIQVTADHGIWLQERQRAEMGHAYRAMKELGLELGLADREAAERAIADELAVRRRPGRRPGQRPS